MKIILRTVGGFTGPAGAQTHVVDVDELSPADAKRFLDHVARAAPSGLPNRLMKALPQPWDFVRHLRIEDGESVREFQFHDEAAPASLRELVEEIEELSARK
jgi:hypothetical protein